MEPIHKIPKFNFDNSRGRNLSSVIVTGERTLRATWSPELAQDLQAYHNIDITEEMNRILSEEITREINRERINIVREQFTQTFWPDIPPVTPMAEPLGILHYLDFQYVQEPRVYNDGSWSLRNYFESVLGIKTEIKLHTFI